MGPEVKSNCASSTTVNSAMSTAVTRWLSQSRMP
jgi:hypothetical protein